MNVLIVNHSHHDTQLFAGHFLQLPGDVLQTSHIMTGVTDYGGVGPKYLPSAHQACKAAHIGKTIQNMLHLKHVSGINQLADGMK